MSIHTNLSLVFGELLDILTGLGLYNLLHTLLKLLSRDQDINVLYRAHRQFGAHY